LFRSRIGIFEQVFQRIDRFLRKSIEILGKSFESLVQFFIRITHRDGIEPRCKADSRRQGPDVLHIIVDL